MRCGSADSGHPVIDHQPTAHARCHLIPQPLLSRAFRPFFLLAALFAMVAMAVWGLVLAGFGPPLDAGWHGHEMIFGYGGAVIAGFVLTAAPNWTGRRPIGARSLSGLILLWVAARLAAVIPGLPVQLRAIVCAAFFAALALAAGWSVIPARSRRNYAVIGLLAAFSILELCFWLVPAFRLRVLNATLMLILVLIAIVGGRVIPLFTGNATPGLHTRPGGQWRDFLAVAILGLLAALALVPGCPRLLYGAIAALGAVTHLARMQGWGARRTLTRPILWVLHLAYFCLSVGLALLAARDFGAPMPSLVPLHVLAVGALGLMTLGMMTRVSLGHTGRVISADRWTTVAYVLLLMAVVVRAGGPFFCQGSCRMVMLLAAGFWMAAFAIFLVSYLRVLVRPRIDGRSG